IAASRSERYSSFCVSPSRSLVMTFSVLVLTGLPNNPIGMRAPYPLFRSDRQKAHHGKKGDRASLSRHHANSRYVLLASRFYLLDGGLPEAIPLRFQEQMLVLGLHTSNIGGSFQLLPRRARRSHFLQESLPGFLRWSSGAPIPMSWNPPQSV